jgi:hypothetical protein
MGLRSAGPLMRRVDRDAGGPNPSSQRLGAQPRLGGCSGSKATDYGAYGEQGRQWKRSETAHDIEI